MTMTVRRRTSFTALRCFHRFRLPSDWGVQDCPGVRLLTLTHQFSLSSLTDSSVDTASDSEKSSFAGNQGRRGISSPRRCSRSLAEKEGSGLLLPGAQTGCYSHSIFLNGEGWTLQSPADATGAEDVELGLPSCQEALDRGILRFLGSGDPCPSAVGRSQRVTTPHTALVERYKFLVLGGLPQQTVFWNQNLTHRNQQVKGGWLLLEVKGGWLFTGVSFS